MDDERSTLAGALQEAYASGTPADGEAFAGLTTDEGYAVQDAFVARRTDAEGPVVGYKLGFTNEAVQREVGVPEPVYGQLLADTVGVERIRTAAFVAPRAEPEIVVRLGERLPGSASRERVETAVDAVAPALEIVDTRTGSWDLDPGPAVADNALAARLVTGPEWSLDEVSPLSAVRVTVAGPDGDRAGEGSAVLGDPLQAVAWLSGAVDGPLPSGTLISTGSLTRTVPVRAGERVAASFTSLGEVSVTPEQ